MSKPYLNIFVQIVQHLSFILLCVLVRITGLYVRSCRLLDKNHHITVTSSLLVCNTIFKCIYYTFHILNTVFTVTTY